MLENHALVGKGERESELKGTQCDLVAMDKTKAVGEEAHEEFHRWRSEMLVEGDGLSGLLRRFLYHVTGGARVHLFLFVLGVVCGAASAAIDFLIALIKQGHFALLRVTSSVPLQLLLWSAYLLAFAFLSLLLVGIVSPKAAGSGLPQMKAILSGVYLPHYLNLRTLFAKIAGLACFLGSGMFAGKEGPFVHIAAIICRYLTRVPLFWSISAEQGLLFLMLRAAVSVGVAGNFGTPIGALLFSVEVTSTYYPVNNYWYSAWATTWATLVFFLVYHLLFGTKLFAPLLATPLLRSADVSLDLLDYLVVVLMSAVLGLVAVAFIAGHSIILQLRESTEKRFSKWYFLNVHVSQFVAMLFLALVTSFISFPGLFGSFISANIPSLRALFSPAPLDSEWSSPSLPLNLLLFGFSKLVLTLFSMNLRVPGGLFIPVMGFGAGLGRAIALLRHDPAYVSAATYAIVGSASIAAAVTQTYSTAVILLEITGELDLAIPIIISVVLSIYVSRLFAVSIYDTTLASLSLPYLPNIPTEEYHTRVDAVMDERCDSFALSSSTTLADLSAVLADDAWKELRSFPVVAEDGLLLGTVRRVVLHRIWMEELEASHGAQPHAPNPYGSDPAARRRRRRSRWAPGSAIDAITAPWEHRHLETDLQSVPYELPSARATTLDFVAAVEEEGSGGGLDDDGSFRIPFRFLDLALHPKAHLNEAHLMLVTHSRTEIFVSENGQLKGVVTRQHLHDLLFRKNRW